MREPDNLDMARMLIVGGRPHAVQLLRQIFDILGFRQIQATSRLATAIELLRTQTFSAVFCDDQIADADPEMFAQAARRTPGLLNPMVPMFLVCTGPRRRDVELARDTGFTDVLTRPLSAATVLRKLKAALAHPRPFIATGEFFGPDRRSAARSWTGEGNDRRQRQPRKVKVAAPVDSDFLKR
jgi:CheY-like chemotaxis protein